MQRLEPSSEAPGHQGLDSLHTWPQAVFQLCTCHLGNLHRMAARELVTARAGGLLDSLLRFAGSLGSWAFPVPPCF